MFGHIQTNIEETEKGTSGLDNKGGKLLRQFPMLNTVCDYVYYLKGFAPLRGCVGSGKIPFPTLIKKGLD